MTRSSINSGRVQALLGGEGSYLLWFGAVLFNVVSVYTTQRGFGIIFGESDVFLRHIGSWVVAVGLSIFMLFFIFRLTTGTLDRLGVLFVVCAYFFVAATSVFFNLNAIYASLAARDLSVSRFYQERQEFELLASQVQGAIGSALADFDRRVADAKAAMDFEEDRIDRPGQGKRWLLLKERHDALVKRSSVAKIPLEREMERVDTLVREARSLPVPEEYADAVQASVQFRQWAAELAALLTRHGEEPTRQLGLLRDPPPDPDNPAFTLSVVWTSVRDAVLGKATGHTFFRFLVAFSLSVLIDFLVFAAVILSHPELFSGNKKMRKLPPWRR